MSSNASSSATTSWSLPPNIDSISFRSPYLIPLYLLLLLFSLQQLPFLLELLFAPPSPSSATTNAFVVPAITRHARFLPTPSRHAFRYNTLYLALRLDKLETRLLDTGHAFAWKGGVLQPEFVDESALAGRKNVTPAGRTVASSEDGDDWKRKMRAAERIERKKLEEKRARNDRYTWSWTGIHPDGYLRNHIPVGDEGRGEWIRGSILLKLAYELRERGFLTVGPQDEDVVGDKDWRSELGQVWTVTMPSVVGLTGINPLTVHYCFRPAGYGESEGKAMRKNEETRGDFWLVVLEVHNTFGERHVYVLEAGKDEDADEVTQQLDPDTLRTESKRKRSGYDHQWTFPRSFHVSPFNDRGGYYRLFLKQPFADGFTFNLGIRLLLLVESDDPSSPTKLVKKLMATLDSVSTPPASSKPHRSTGRHTRPLSPATLYAAILRQPFDLFLTFARILYQAAKLHFAKRLDAFGRPDMVQVTEEVLAQEVAGYDGVGLPPAVNRIQAHRSAAAGANSSAGGLLYPPAGWAEGVAKEFVAQVLQKRVQELQAERGERWTVEVRSTDPADPGLIITSSSTAADSKEKHLILFTRSHSIYVDLMTYAPPRLALLLGSIATRRWGVNSVELFDDFFAGPDRGLSRSGVRRRYLEFLLAEEADRGRAARLLEAWGAGSASDGGKDGEGEGGWKVNVALWMGYVAAVAEKKVFGWLGARYVKGTEPWLELHRGLEYIERTTGEESKPKKGDAGWDEKLGSVYSG
ncbi:hypothetical protein PHSY_005773 [Pseudozyma hubeiensis SY62]|uniref:Uncharacterized protein n=1 Tax=Pseudozyma hubeiensis (strain SY62) TaxID=1305764 RepID=R9PA03_PSEHS|nr:hypothetical protein PHSY_005773 [Pseudozyma hubeiensis SY62]GAC98184.1 hypothetical protein PHSY_005773 [Pseudozyma hubeiensis SY62]